MDIRTQVKPFVRLLPLMVVVLGLVGYNFMSAQWTPPPVGTVPPANNVAAPINVGSSTQSKIGNINANIFAATNHMRSDAYCDSLGNNCFTLSTSTFRDRENGFLEIGDILIQWGVARDVNMDQSFRTINFPRAFTNVHSINSSIQRDTSAYGGVISGTVATVMRNITLTSFEVAGDHDSYVSVADINWFAIGSSRPQSGPVYTYSWITSAWGSCTSNSVDRCDYQGTEQRTVSCQRSDGSSAANSSCTAPKPSISRACTVTWRPSGC